MAQQFHAVINKLAQVGKLAFLLAFILASQAQAQTQVMGEFGCEFTRPKSGAFWNNMLVVPDADRQRVIGKTAAGNCVLVAGTSVRGFTGDGGPATAARLNNPTALEVATDGDLIISDANNGRLRRIDLATGIITTMAVAPSGSYMWGVHRTPDGTYLWTAFNMHQVYKVSEAGGVAVVAGKAWNGGWSGDGGQANQATLNSPTDAIQDSAGNIFIADYNNQRIRKISPAGIISTIAGDGYAITSGDGGPAISARLAQPHLLALDDGLNLYIGQLMPGVPGAIRRINSSGIIATPYTLPAPVEGLFAHASSLYGSAGRFLYGEMSIVGNVVSTPTRTMPPTHTAKPSISPTRTSTPDTKPTCEIETLPVILNAPCQGGDIQ